MFDGTLDKYTGSFNILELTDDAKPYQAKIFPTPKTHKSILKK